MLVTISFFSSEMSRRRYIINVWAVGFFLILFFSYLFSKKDCHVLIKTNHENAKESSFFTQAPTMNGEKLQSSYFHIILSGENKYLIRTILEEFIKADTDKTDLNPVDSNELDIVI